jgi:hypothetical protein
MESSCAKTRRARLRVASAASNPVQTSNKSFRHPASSNGSKFLRQSEKRPPFLGVARVPPLFVEIDVVEGIVVHLGMKIKETRSQKHRPFRDLEGPAATDER